MVWSQDQYGLADAFEKLCADKPVDCTPYDAGRVMIVYRIARPMAEK